MCDLFENHQSMGRKLDNAESPWGDRRCNFRVNLELLNGSVFIRSELNGHMIFLLFVDQHLYQLCINGLWIYEPPSLVFMCIYLTRSDSFDANFINVESFYWLKNFKAWLGPMTIYSFNIIFAYLPITISFVVLSWSAFWLLSTSNFLRKRVIF